MLSEGQPIAPVILLDYKSRETNNPCRYMFSKGQSIAPVILLVSVYHRGHTQTCEFVCRLGYHYHPQEGFTIHVKRRAI